MLKKILKPIIIIAVIILIAAFGYKYIINMLGSFITSDDINQTIEKFEEIKEESKNYDHPLLSDEQEKILDTIGIDSSIIPTEITPEMQKCFIEKLGAERVNEILEGDTPGIMEIFKAKSCI